MEKKTENKMKGQQPKKKETQIKAAIVGASGYVGLELMRILLQHPNVEITAVTSRTNAHKPVSEIHSSLLGCTNLKFSEFSHSMNADVVFFALPHTESMQLVPKLIKKGKKIIDMGADFRLDSGTFRKTYSANHAAPGLLKSAVYGMPELFKAEIAKAQLVANPGCFANCIILGLAPLATLGLINSKEAVNVSAITGSSGSGSTPNQKTHHPERVESISAYNILSHRHVPEIESALSKICKTSSGSNSEFNINLIPQSGPFSRGIFAVSFAKLSQPLAQDKLQKIYTDFAKNNPFIRIRHETPKLIEVRGSNYCDISANVTEGMKSAVIISALDNLVKGAAGNAVQCMNLMFGLPENEGLKIISLCP